MGFCKVSSVHHLFSRSRTELAVLASRPVVGSSRNKTAGSIISSIPMFVLFLSPPEIPRVICVPTWRGKSPRRIYNSFTLSHQPAVSSTMVDEGLWMKMRKLCTLESATLVRPSSLIRWLTRASFSLWGTELGRRSAAEKLRFCLTVSVPITTSS